MRILELLLDLLQLLSLALAVRDARLGISPVPILPSDMRVAKEVEGLRLAFSSSFPVLFGIPPELDPGASFPGAKAPRSELPQPFFQVLAKTVCVRIPLEAEDGCRPRSGERSPSPRATLLARQTSTQRSNTIVEIDVGKKR